MRCVFTACEMLKNGAAPKEPHELYAMLESSVPDLHKGLPSERPMIGRERGWRLIKSHNLREIIGHRMVYIFRRPEVALVSYAHYAGRATGGADRFVLRQVRTWAAEGEVALAMPRDAACFVAYEDLRADPGRWVSRMAGHLELGFDEPTVTEALELMNFERMKKSEGSGHRVEKAPGGSFFRRGGKTLDTGELCSATLEAVQKWASPVYDQLLAIARGG